MREACFAVADQLDSGRHFTSLLLSSRSSCYLLSSKCSCLQRLTGPAVAEQQQLEGHAEPLLLQRNSSLLGDFAEQRTARQGWVPHRRMFVCQGPMGWTPCWTWRTQPQSWRCRWQCWPSKPEPVALLRTACPWLSWLPSSRGRLPEGLYALPSGSKLALQADQALLRCSQGCSVPHSRDKQALNRRRVIFRSLPLPVGNHLKGWGQRLPLCLEAP